MSSRKQIPVPDTIGEWMAILSLLGGVVLGLWWLDDANETHEVVPANEDRIVELERSGAEYRILWDNAIESRQKEIRKAEEFYKENRPE